MWICPKCKREFKNSSQLHSCGNFSIEKVFEKYLVEIFYLFEIIHNLVHTFGKMNINPVINGVMFSVNSTILALKLYSKYLLVEFACGNEHDEFPVEKCVQISKTEFAHILRVENDAEIDKQLIVWLKEAYHFNCTKN